MCGGEERREGRGVEGEGVAPTEVGVAMLGLRSCGLQACVVESAGRFGEDGGIRVGGGDRCVREAESTSVGTDMLGDPDSCTA